MQPVLSVQLSSMVPLQWEQLVRSWMSDMDVLAREQHQVSSLVCSIESTLISVITLSILDSLKVLRGVTEHNVNSVQKFHDRWEFASKVFLMHGLVSLHTFCCASLHATRSHTHSRCHGPKPREAEENELQKIIKAICTAGTVRPTCKHAMVNQAVLCQPHPFNRTRSIKSLGPQHDPNPQGH